jgi:hypothetical protein
MTAFPYAHVLLAKQVTAASRARVCRRLPLLF